MRTPLHPALATALIAAGCGRDRAHLQIGVALPVDSGAFIQEVRRGLQRPADSLGFELLVANAGGDTARQAAQVDSLVAQRVAAVVIDPVDGTAIAAAVARANRAHVPVFTLVDAVEGEGAVVSHIGSDDRMGGELVGWYVAQRLKGGGNVAILDQPRAASARDRLAGLRLAFSRFPNIRIVASPAVEPASREAARQKTATLLAADQRIDAFVGATDDLALGALDGVQAAGRKDVLVAGFGASPEARAAILQGTALVADVAPDPYTIGRYALLVAASHLRSNRVASLVPVPVRLVNRDSLAAP
jgi:ribose transport system substrate-binding protein